MPKTQTAATVVTAPPLADQLSALLSADELPADVYNPLAESLLDLADRARVTLLTPEVLRVALPLILDRLAATEAAYRGWLKTSWRGRTPPSPADWQDAVALARVLRSGARDVGELRRLAGLPAGRCRRAARLLDSLFNHALESGGAASRGGGAR